ncbi:uncharacterized protein LOC119190041 [Manduca sexta]|uniref:uncharacterized protein LOC119190041 n=1 Tax=Manduca sexta TaxID=7130 RepID=UPI00188DF675|nr:uncharacterized protein LOC119190041 [Manduca sexta]
MPQRRGRWSEASLRAAMEAVMEDPFKVPTKRAMWSEESLRAAMKAVQEGHMTHYAAAELYNIPRSTLWDHLVSGKTVKRTGRYPVMNTEQEEHLVGRLIDKSKTQKLTNKIIRREAFIMCQEWKLKHNFNLKTGLAGIDWLRMFLKRHPEISNAKQ